MIIIGAGRVGGALFERAQQRGARALLIDRQSGWERFDEFEGAPILVAVRNDDLDPVLDRIPAARRGDLVFIQNGMLRDFLAERGLGAASRGLLFFAVPHRGAPIEPGAPSPFHGPRAAQVVTWLGSLGIDARNVDARTFTEAELEKLLWNCVFGLLCERFEATVGTVVEDHRDVIETLVEELVRVVAPVFEFDVTPEWTKALIERLCTYSSSIPGYRGAVKEWSWRNGWFVDAARRRGVSTPLHDELLQATGHPTGHS